MNEFRHVANLNTGEWLEKPNEILEEALGWRVGGGCLSLDLLEQAVVEGVEVREDDGISLELRTVLGQSGSEVIEGPFFVGGSNCTHGLYVRSGKLYAAPSCSRREILETNVQGKEGSTVDQRSNFFSSRRHDLTEEHVLERKHRIGGVKVLKGVESFDKVRKPSAEVLLLRVDDAGLHVDGGLQRWRAVNGTSSCTCGSKGSSRSGKITQVVVQTRLDQVNLDEKRLVVQLTHL